MAPAARLFEAIRRPLRAFAPETWTLQRAARVVVGLLAIAVCADAALRVVGPMLPNLHLMGKHDWDSEASYRYITALSILKYHEMPWWHPYLCGGFSAWGFSETATNVVSLYLPAHLLFPVAEAIRIEIVGNTAISLVATYFFVGRFTRNAGLRALVALVYAINGRFALQLTSGHAWHMQYAWTPVALYFFDVSLDRGKLRTACWAGAAIAMTVYSGGIYPLPHTALAIGIYATFLAAARRSWRPLVAFGITGATAVGFSAPKLLPVYAVMKRFPRLIDSPESADLGKQYEMLANPHQTFDQGPVGGLMWAWHEWGIYVGPIIVGCMVVALLAAGVGSRFSALRATGIVFFTLGLGAFAEFAPWTLLHKLPVFSSQHVPSRFVYVAVLLMMTAFAALVGSFIDRFDRRLPWLSLLLLLPAWRIGVDIADVGAVSTAHVFYMQSPKIEPREAFIQSQHSEYEYTPAESRAGATLLAMERNEGYVDCDIGGSPKPRGAIWHTEAGYRGEAYILDGPGTAAIVEWSPNHAVIQYDGARAGSTLMYNMNFDPDWRANGEPVLDVNHAIGALLPDAHGRVELRYRPRMLVPGLLIFLATVLAIGLGPAGVRRLYRRGQLG